MNIVFIISITILLSIFLVNIYNIYNTREDMRLLQSVLSSVGSVTGRLLKGTAEDLVKKEINKKLKDLNRELDEAKEKGRNREAESIKKKIEDVIQTHDIEVETLPSGEIVAKNIRNIPVIPNRIDTYNVQVPIFPVVVGAPMGGAGGPGLGPVIRPGFFGFDLPGSPRETLE